MLTGYNFPVASNAYSQAVPLLPTVSVGLTVLAALYLNFVKNIEGMSNGSSRS